MPLYIFIWSRDVSWSEKIAQKLIKTDVECISADDPRVREIIKEKINKIPAIIVCENKKGKSELYIEEDKGHIYTILGIE